MLSGQNAAALHSNRFPLIILFEAKIGIEIQLRLIAQPQSWVYLINNILSPLFILELMPEFILESFPALYNFMNRK